MTPAVSEDKIDIWNNDQNKETIQKILKKQIPTRNQRKQ